MFVFLLTRLCFKPLAVYALFFCLDAKEPKNQGKRDAAAALPYLASPSVTAFNLTFYLLA